MNSMNGIFEANSVVEWVGLSLVHFLWQAVIVWGFVELVVSFVRGAKANLRYLIFAGGMLLMLACPMATFVYLYPEQGFSEPMPISDPVVNANAMSIASAYVPMDEIDTAVMDEIYPGFVVDRSEREFGAAAFFVGAIRHALPWLVAIWVIGVLLHLLKIGAGLLGVRRWKANAVQIEDGRLLQQFEKLKSGMGIQAASLMGTSEMMVSAVIGIWNPVVLLPTSLMAGLSPRELELVLAHELAHIRRFDFGVNIIQKVVESILFFHPAVWRLSRQMSQEREHCCDDIAAEYCGDRVALAKALTTLESLRCQQDLVVAANGGSLSTRIRRLLVQESRPVQASFPVGIAIATLLLTFVWSLLPGGSEIASANVDPNISELAETRSTDINLAEAESDDEPLRKTSKFEVRKKDPVTGIDQLVFENIRLTVTSRKAKTETGVDLKYSNVIPYTFIPEHAAKSLKATKLGEIDFAQFKPVKNAGNVSLIFTPNDFSKPTGFRKDGVEGTYVDFVTENKSGQTIVPYATDALWAPDHLGFYGLNKTKQTKFDVVRIDEFDLGIGKKLGPFNALVLNDENSRFGLLGSVVCRQIRGENDEALWHLAATNEFRLMKRSGAKKAAEAKVKQPALGDKQATEKIEGIDVLKTVPILKHLFDFPQERNGQNEISIRSIDVGRTPTELLQHFRFSIERHGSPKRTDSITNMESIVSAMPTTRNRDTFHAPEVNFNLPEGSKSRAAILGRQMQIKLDENQDVKFIVPNGRLQLIDSVGVIRAEAAPVDEADELIVSLRIDLNEVAMKISSTGAVRVNTNTDSGAPADEGQPPHGSVRYELLDENPEEGKPLRIKMKWRYDVDRLAAEAEAESGKSWQQIIWGDDYKDENLDSKTEVNAKDLSEVRVFNLKHLSPIDAERIVRKLAKEYSDLSKPLVVPRLAIQRNGSVIVSATPAFLEKVNASFEELDVQGDSKHPWRVFGKVTDERGNAISGVSVKAHCGMGTLRETGNDTTDAQGRFDFRFGPGIWSENKQMVQAATISVSLAGHVEKNLHRQGDLVASLEKPEGKISWGEMTEDQLFLPGKPIELNFVMVKSLTIKGMIVVMEG